jgi:type II secretory pathway component PulK
VAAPFADPAELPRLRGDSALHVRLVGMLTTRGGGQINLNAAPLEVLRALPGFSEEAVRALMARRGLRPLQSLDELLGALTPGGRETLLKAYADLVRTTTVAPAQLVAVVEGGVATTPIVSRATLTLVPVPEQLAVIRREVE